MNSSLSRRDALKLTGTTILAATASKVFAQTPQEKTAPATPPEERTPAAPLPTGIFQDGQYLLPELPYAYDALEPAYQATTLKLHHQKHHAGYVRGLNNTLEMIRTAQQTDDYRNITALSRSLAFHGSGNILHGLFWNSMTPGGSEIPDDLAEAITQSFGSTDICRKQFVAATNAVEASGWSILAYEPVADHLIILQAEKHQNLTLWGAVPLLVCDVWEHAYYLQYENRRNEWIDAFMTIANWNYAAQRLRAARK